MANKKSSGTDEISPRVLKLSLPYTVESLTYIYNMCILHTTFPTVLKEAKVIPLPKTKDVSDVNNYRPISLLSALSKPLERHIHKHLYQYLDSHNLLFSFQSGFRPKHSCPTALTRIIDTWLINVNNSKITGAVFLDLSKAFDMVDHNVLLLKLQHYLCNPNAVSLFQSYLDGRKQKVLVNGRYSTEALVKSGVPQGSVLGPLLFCIFINDLPLHLSDSSVSCDLFADDATLHTPDKDISVINARLQTSLHEVSDWCESNSMVLNPSKTECMVITTRQKHQLSPLKLDLHINGNPVQQVTQHKLLGVVVDDQLKWEAQIESVCKQI